MNKIIIHSSVDVITNSSTVIYMYQNSIDQVKELIQATFDLHDIKDMTPDDIFYYGVFCDNETYLDAFEYDHEDLPTDIPDDWRSRDEWMSNLKLSIMKGDVQKPEWMEVREHEDDWWDPSTYLHLEPKKGKYKSLANSILAVLNSVSADGGRDG